MATCSFFTGNVPGILSFILATAQQVNVHVIFAFDVDGASFLKSEQFIENGYTGFGGLDAAVNSGGIHATGDVDSIAPNIIIKFRSADDTSSYVTTVVADSDDEIEFQ